MTFRRHSVRVLVVVLSLFFIGSSANAESSLPPCPGDYNETTRTDCVGTYSIADVGKYVGEWKDGKRHGQGIGATGYGRESTSRASPAATSPASTTLK